MLNKHDLYQKESIRLNKRLNELSKEMRNQPFIEVTPFQRGWETSIVLREDISNRKDANFIQHLIDIGYEKFSIVNKLKHVKLIKQGIYQYQYKSRGDIVTVSFIPNKIKFSEKQYESLSDREKRFFYKDIRYHGYSAPYVSYYLMIPEYWIKLKATPRMYDKIMDKNGALESEYDLVSSKLQKPPYDKYFYRGRSSWRRETVKRSLLNKLILKEQREELELCLY